ncbi:unnamed protein product [Clonostachys byssicola]|uniref:Major facilitator superfamily (MFS) profile domain-containing protein n=1 Tax=Clonostachys byssicola TaxID=160290 RepID=A0A9N9XSC5_9HYPO|nr:unnamed protein product [Clonostachys byssicola]
MQQSESSPESGSKSRELTENATEKPKTDDERGTQETPDPQFLSGLRLASVMVGLMLSVFCLGLDRSILATAIPKITTEFNSLNDIAWYGSAYLISTCCFQLMFGKLYATFPLKTIFLSALGLFEVGSIFCAAAPNSVTLIIGRAIAGIGCSGVLCGGVVIITVSLPLHKRPKYAGIFSAASGVAQILAPTLGGIFTDRATWRWCFWINLPLGAVTAAVVLFLVKMPDRPSTEEEDQQRGQFSRLKSFFSKLDVIGTTLLMPCMICLNLALQWGGTTLPWSNWRVILCLSMFGVTFILWCYVQYSRGDQATLPVRIMKQRSVASGTWFSFSHGALRSLIIYYIPIWFQVVKDTNAEQSGINFLAASIAMVASVILTGQLTSRIGYYVPQMLCSTVIVSISLGLIYRYNLDTTTAYWAGTLVMFGFGSGMGQQQPVTACQTVLKGRDVPLGTSTVLLAQTLGGAVFLAVGQNIFQSRLVEQLSQNVPNIDPRTVLDHGASGLKAAVTTQYGDASAQAVLAAYNDAIQRCFLICVILSCLTIFGGLTMEWVSVKKPETDRQAPTPHLDQPGEQPKTNPDEAKSERNNACIHMPGIER